MTLSCEALIGKTLGKLTKSTSTSKQIKEIYYRRHCNYAMDAISTSMSSLTPICQSVSHSVCQSVTWRALGSKIGSTWMLLLLTTGTSAVSMYYIVNSWLSTYVTFFMSTQFCLNVVNFFNFYNFASVAAWVWIASALAMFPVFQQFWTSSASVAEYEHEPTWAGQACFSGYVLGNTGCAYYAMRIANLNSGHWSFWWMLDKQHI